MGASTPPPDSPRASRPSNVGDTARTRDSSATRVGPSFDAEKAQYPLGEESENRSNNGAAFFQDGPGRDEEAEGTRGRDDLLAAAARSSSRKQPEYTADGKRVMTEDECYHLLGYSWPAWKKWMLLSSIFAVQVSMNFNTSVYPSAVTPLSEAFHISEQAARTGQCAFLVLYAFGCELWAPWSEEFGRWKILQSVFLLRLLTYSWGGGVGTYLSNAGVQVLSVLGQHVADPRRVGSQLWQHRRRPSTGLWKRNPTAMERIG